MVRKTSRKITYLLASRSSHHGHTLGINGLAVDPSPGPNPFENSGTLYSAGRDGMIMAWALDDIDLHPQAYNIDDDSAAAEAPPPPASSAKGKSTFKAQVQAHTHWVNDIVLANNYQTVVSCSSDLSVKSWSPGSGAQATVGQHHDFVKCLAVPDQAVDWVASGGLDRKVNLWDLRGGQKLTIDVGNRGENPKGSVYALGIGAPGGTIIGSGGPDSIVRLWDQRTGDSIVNFLGHTDNIRSILINSTGNLVLTASSDATVKLWSITAGRLIHTLNMHDTSVWSLHSEHPNLEVFHSSDRSGLVVKTDMRGITETEDSVCVLVANEHQGVNKIVAAGDNIWTATANSRIHRWKDVDTTQSAIHVHRKRRTSSASYAAANSNALLKQATANSAIPAASLISLSLPEPDDGGSNHEPVLSEPVRHNPEETIEGQTGLIKHILLNDRRRVLTVDTAGEVVLWDLIRCLMVRSYGSRDIQDVADEINTFETMANWCQVNTRTGQLAVVLEESYCFDAEIYADEVARELEPVEFRDDQRINLGKWVLRNLFANLIDAQLARDDQFRSERKARSEKGPGTLSFAHIPAWSDPTGATTPGLAIGLATPMPAPAASSLDEALSPAGTGTAAATPASPPAATDYFSSVPESATAEDDLSSPSSLMGRLRSFGKVRMRAPTEKQPQDSIKEEPAPLPTPAEEPKPEPSYDDTLAGVLQKVRAESADNEASALTVSPGNETPLLRLPADTAIIISEQRVDAGGTVDLYRGTVASCGDAGDVDTLEAAAPGWLAEFLLLNKTPQKDLVKVSFVLQPFDDSLPHLPNGNARLNAYRMLRGKKILAYVDEKLDASVKRGSPRPDEWLELVCQGQVVDNAYTLATIRARIWRSGGDVVLMYRRKS